MKAENGPFLEKMAPCVAPSPLPLKTPETEVAKGGQDIGRNPGNLRGSISVPLAGLNPPTPRCPVPCWTNSEATKTSSPLTVWTWFEKEELYLGSEIGGLHL